jgi:alpha-tubulin suppressor-like RCC1 family protein
VAFKVCCKDKGCGSKVLTPAGVDGSTDLVTRRDGQGTLSETGPDSPTDAPPALDAKGADLGLTPFDGQGPGDVVTADDAAASPDGPADDAAIKLDTPDAPPEADGPQSNIDSLAGVDSLVSPDLPSPDLKTPDAPGTCASDQDCPTTLPTCLKGICARCASANDCSGNVLGGMCDPTTGRCASCLADTDCKDATKPLCGQGKCTSCTYATSPNGCCADTDCTTGGAFMVGRCNTTAHACSYACDSNHKSCITGGLCIPTASCCVDADCVGGGAGTAGKCTSNTCSYPCDPNHKSCTPGGACVPTSNCCADLECNAGNVCDASGACVPMTGCGSTPTLGCACTQSGTTKCNGSAQKVRLICAAPTTGQPGLAWQLLDTCSSTAPGYNCDNRDATCQPILPGCAGHAAGFAYCDTSGSSLYMDVRKTCGPDLVSNDTTTTCTGVCLSGVCQSATCGDHKVQTNEECDDGNAVALDGCEPGTCVKSAVVKLAVGDGHTCALCKGGHVRCWGENTTNGQLGLGHTNFVGDKNPYQILDAAGNPGMVNLGGEAATDISAGYGFTCALLAGGSVRCWGANDTGQLGLGNTTPMPTQVGAAINFGSGLTATAIAAGWGYACAVLSNATVRCWGDNSAGLLGLGNTQAVLSGTVALGSATAVGIATGGSNACALLSGGSIHCWGDNYFGEFGIGTQTPMDSTATLPSAYGNAVLKSGRTASSIGVGASLNCARLDDGEVECWGYNNVGQLGLGNTATIGDNEVPGSVGLVSTGATAVAQIAVGSIHVCALYANSAGLKCWGSNGKGQLGYGDITNRGSTNGTIPASLSPIQLPAGLSATAVYAGTANTCVVLSDGSVRCWGWNDRGQLGLGKVSGTQVGTPDYIGGASNETPSQLAGVQVFPP